MKGLTSSGDRVIKRNDLNDSPVATGLNDLAVANCKYGVSSLRVPDDRQPRAREPSAKAWLNLRPDHPYVALSNDLVEHLQDDGLDEIELGAHCALLKQTLLDPPLPGLTQNTADLADTGWIHRSQDIRGARHTTHIMTHQNAQKVATLVSHPTRRAAEIRAVLDDPKRLRLEATRVLDALPRGCDLLAWSPEGATIAAVASVIADEAGRRVRARRASMLEPLHKADGKSWVWVSVEELLGCGHVRTWAVEWAHGQGGRPHDDSIALAG